MKTSNETPRVINGALTESQVAAFKEKHRKSFAVEVRDGDEVHVAARSCARTHCSLWLFRSSWGRF